MTASPVVRRLARLVREGALACSARPKRVTLTPTVKNRREGVTPSRRFAGAAVAGCILTLLVSCNHVDPRPCAAYVLENRLYTAANGAEGPPFPYYLHSFCLEVSGEATYSFALSDARKTVHAVFALEFSDFEESEREATATYERSTFQVITDFAEDNALSKWLSCRDAIRSRTVFAIDDCEEVDSGSIVRIGPGEHGAQDAESFPCGINVGPDRVRGHDGDEVPEDVYSGRRSSLTGMIERGTRMSLHTDERIKRVYVPEIFFGDLTFSSELSSCGDGR